MQAVRKIFQVLFCKNHQGLQEPRWAHCAQVMEQKATALRRLEKARGAGYFSSIILEPKTQMYCKILYENLG